MFQGSKKVFVRSALAAAALASSAGGAQAAVWTGTWDPLFSPPFTNLWWRGSATFDTGPCTADGLHVNAGLCAGMGVSNVVLEFANSFAGATLQTLDFQTAYGAMTPIQITGMQISGGNLVGVYTDYYSFGIQGAITESQLAGPTQQPYFSIAFIGAQATLGYKREAAYSFSCIWNTSPFIRRGDCGSQPADIIFSQVPEPGTYALMGLGLAALVGLRRKKALSA